MTKINAGCIPIAIGSFPHATPEEALEKILTYFPEIPLWPQLPSADRREQMYVQYAEGMTGITYDEERGKLTAGETDDAFFDSMAAAFEHILTEDFNYFSISRDYARGLYLFLEEEDRIRNTHPRWVKGHITGPVSFLLMVTDQAMKPVLYNDSYRELVKEVLKMKALWQVYVLREIHPEVIIFIDEPYLASFGSSMVALSREDVVSLIGDISQALQARGARSGVHCCGNTDWSLLFDTKCDIISFDAYEYGENFMLYRDGARKFLANGGAIAWGIVPTSDKVDGETAETLMEKLKDLMKKLETPELPFSDILEQSFISPACGLDGVPADRAERIMQLTQKVSEMLQEMAVIL